MPLLPFGSPPTPDATTLIKGKIKLAGDLGGTAALPVVAKVNGIPVTGTPSAGQAIVATSPTAAAWAAPAAQRTIAYWMG